MAIIILNYRVEDYSIWKEFYDRDKEQRSALGLKEIKVGVKSDDLEHVYIIWEAEDSSTIENLLSDPDLKNKMDESGVTGPPEVLVIL